MNSYHKLWVCSEAVDTEYWKACNYYRTKELAIEAARKAWGKAKDDDTNDFEDTFGYLPDSLSDTRALKSFAVGQCISAALPNFSDTVIEHAWESVYDEVGEFATDYLDDVTKEEKIELDSLIKDWFIRNNNLPSCYTIRNVEEVSFLG